MALALALPLALALALALPLALALALTTGRGCHRKLKALNTHTLHYVHSIMSIALCP